MVLGTSFGEIVRRGWSDRFRDVPRSTTLYDSRHSKRVSIKVGGVRWNVIE